MSQVKISQILQEIEKHFPLTFQEGFDNCGIQIGDSNRISTGVICCVDVNEEVIDYAIEYQINTIIAHHPLLFHPIKRMTGATYVERCIIKAIKHDILVYAAHTNVDNGYGGLNWEFARRINLKNVCTLQPKKDQLLKLVTYVPQTHLESVAKAVWEAGAGEIGNYQSCGFSSCGLGSFQANENATPFVGKIGELHYEKEEQWSVILPKHLKSKVVKALLKAHPYEEVAYDLFPIINEWNRCGSGVVGECEEIGFMDFLYQLKAEFNVKHISYSKVNRPTTKKIRRIAICTGAGAFMLKDAAHHQADILITGEAKHNDYLDACQEDPILVTLGHFETETVSVDIFERIISEIFPKFAVHKVVTNQNPISYLV